MQTLLKPLRRTALFLFSLFFPVVLVFPAHAVEPRPLTMAPLAEIPPAQMEAYATIRDHIEKRLQRPVHLAPGKNYTDLLNQFGEGKIDIFFGGSYTYQLAKERYGAIPVAQWKIDGKTDFQSYIFVRKESGIEDLRQLQGRRFAFTDPLSTSGYLVPRVRMAEEAGIIDPSQFFSEIKFKQNYRDLFDAVFLGEVDAGAIASYQFDGFGRRAQLLRVIWKSPPLSFGFVFANGQTLFETEIAEIRKAFFSIGKTPETESLAKVFEFVEPPKNVHDWVDGYRKRLDALPRVEPHPKERPLLPKMPSSLLSPGLSLIIIAILFVPLLLYVLYDTWRNRERLSKGFSLRLVVAFVVVIFLAGLVTVVAIYFPLKERLTRNADESAILFTQTVLLAAHDAILHGDKTYLARYAESLIRQHEAELTHVAFYGKEGALLASAGRVPLEETLSLSTISLPVMVGEQQEGKVAIGFSQERATRVWKEALFAILLITLLTTLIAILVALKDTLRITQPIADLTAYTKQIAAGQLDQKAPVVSNDEIGQLAEAFNQMMEKLKNTIFREKKLEDINVVLAEASHRLKNVIAGINNYAFLLQEKFPHDSSGRREVDLIREKVKEFYDIAGMLVLRETSFKSVDLLEVLNKAVANADSRAKENSIEIMTRHDPPPFKIKGDGERLTSVFDNLISNAIEALMEKKEGTRSIQITFRRREDKIIAEVEDNGSGILEEILPRIFDPFFTTKGEKKGTGPDLYTTYLAVKQHGGRIDVEQREEGGSRFIVEFPTNPEGLDD